MLLTRCHERKMHSVLEATVLLSIFNLISACECMVMRFKLLTRQSSSKALTDWGSRVPYRAIVPSGVENRKSTCPLSMFYMRSPRIQARGEV